jgi:hypothetical protein
LRSLARIRTSDDALWGEVKLVGFFGERRHIERRSWQDVHR